MDEEAPDQNPNPFNWLRPPPEPSLPAPSPPVRSTATVLALIAGIGGMLLACAASGLLILFPGSLGTNDLPLFVSGILTVGAFGLPLSWNAWRRLHRASAHWQAQRWWIAAGAVLALAALACGQLSMNIHPATGYALGSLQPIIFAAVAAILLALTADGWHGFSRLRAWAHLVSGAWLSITLSFLVEAIAVGAIGLAILAALAIIMPDSLIEFTQRYHSIEDLDMNLILGWVLQPWAIALALIVAALIVPMIEELIKPIGVAIVARRRPDPMAAYLGGVMGGLGFALTETLGNLVNIAEPWLVLIMARMGTMAMHGFTSGLVGWGWGQLAAKRPWRLAGAYAGAVALHGLWNGSVVIIVFSGLYFQQNPNPDSAAAILIGSVAAVCALFLLFLVPACVAGMAWVGHRLRNTDH